MLRCTVFTQCWRRLAAILDCEPGLVQILPTLRLKILTLGGISGEILESEVLRKTPTWSVDDGGLMVTALTLENFCAADLPFGDAVTSPLELKVICFSLFTSLESQQETWVMQMKQASCRCRVDDVSVPQMYSSLRRGQHSSVLCL